MAADTTQKRSATIAQRVANTTQKRAATFAQRAAEERDILWEPELNSPILSDSIEMH